MVLLKRAVIGTIFNVEVRRVVVFEEGSVRD
jgi:hypothetical protein